MKRTALCIVLCIAFPAPAAAQVTAEPWFRAGTLMLTAEVGAAAFTDFTRTQARPTAGTLELGDFNRRVSAQTSGSFGGWVSYWVANGWGIRAGTSYVPTKFRVWNDESARKALDDFAPDAEDPQYASLGILMANVSLMFRFPRSIGRVTPYGLVGGGLIRYKAGDAEDMPPEARSRFAGGDWQTGAVLVGLGAVIPLQRENLLMSFELTSHLARAPLRDKGAGEVFELSGVPMQIQTDAEPGGSDPVGLTNHLRLAFGITLPLR